jgi:hypothetical protein
MSTGAANIVRGLARGLFSKHGLLKEEDIALVCVPFDLQISLQTDLVAVIENEFASSSIKYQLMSGYYGKCLSALREDGAPTKVGFFRLESSRWKENHSTGIGSEPGFFLDMFEKIERLESFFGKIGIKPTILQVRDCVWEAVEEATYAEHEEAALFLQGERARGNDWLEVVRVLYGMPENWFVADM